MGDKKYIIKRCSEDKYLVKDTNNPERITFTENILYATRMTFKEAETANILLQIDGISTWIYSAESLERVSAVDLLTRMGESKEGLRKVEILEYQRDMFWHEPEKQSLIEKLLRKIYSLEDKLELLTNNK